MKAANSVRARPRPAKKSRGPAAAAPATEIAAAEVRSREQKIAEAAYFRAQQRNFESGRELDDWVAAELEIDSLNTAHQESIDDANIIGPIP